MKTSIYYLLAVCGLILTSACKKDQAATVVQIRVQNATLWAFYDCIVDPTGGFSGNATYNSNYGQVDVNMTTPYRACSGAYNYGYVKLTMNSKVYTIQPIDYVGETPLPSGKYTYKITYSTTSDRLEMAVNKD